TPRHLTPNCSTTTENDTRVYNYCDSDIPFSVTVSGMSDQTSAEKVDSSIANVTRLLIINYPSGNSTIKIQGIALAPEFWHSLSVGIDYDSTGIDIYGNATETVVITGNADNATATNPLSLQVLNPMNQSYA